MRIKALLTAIGEMTVIVAAASALWMAPIQPAAAQHNPVLTNVIPESEAVTVQAKISAINPATRAVTLVGANGSSVTVTAGPLVRLELLKVGDTVNAKYYRSVAFVVSPPQASNSAPTANDSMTQLAAQPATAPGGVGVRRTTISAAVVGINVAARTLDLVNPSGGGVYTVHVTDPARAAKLGTLKVGDRITAVISEAFAVSIEPAPTSFF
jgi:hypothetical protein